MQETKGLKEGKSSRPYDQPRIGFEYVGRSNNQPRFQKKPGTLDENKIIAKQGGTIAGNTRKQIEAKTGKKIVSKINAKNIVEGEPKRKKLK